MPKESKKDLERLEAKKIKERTKFSLRERLFLLIYARTNKYQWHTMPFFLMHMLACAYADISSLELVKTAAQTRFGSITSLMKKINLLVEMGIDLPRSIEITRKEARLPYLRDFLQRLAQVARIGEDVIVFLNKEYSTFMIMYSSECERANIRLRRLIEAYSAILSSAALIVLIIIFSGMLWGGGITLVSSTVPAVIMIYVIFALTFYLSSFMLKLVSREEKSDTLSRYLKLEKTTIRGTIILYLITSALLISGFVPRILGIMLCMFSGLPLLMVGYVGRRKLKLIENLDERFPEFITILSTSLATMGTSVIQAFRDISRLDFGKFSPYIKRMAARLELGIDKTISWNSLKKETSSELIRLHVDAFSRANTYGAPAKTIGPIITNSSIFLLTLRKRVEETATLMKGIVVPMVPIICAIIGLVMAIVETFSEMFVRFQSAGIYVIFADTISVPSILPYIYAIIVALSIVNAFIIYELSGEQEFYLCFYLGYFIISGWLSYFLCLTIVTNYLSYIGLSRVMPLPF
ncbi:type II secretion system F family protein [Candidatus Bathyarchaeota archaeon]|nr:type II secretion system F family protein [Candidatus Bathyarchaeota archaeon]